MPLDLVIESFFAKPRPSIPKVLLLDYDGTLAPFSEDRLRAFPDPNILRELKALLRDHATRVAILSGRSAVEVRQLLSVADTVEIWGCHGREKLSTEGHLSFYGLPADADTKLQSLADLIKKYIDDRKVEIKTGCIAIHWRGATSTERSRALNLVENDLNPEIRRRGFELRSFNGGVELSLPGRNKGDVVSEIIREYPCGSLAIAYLGDDITDEDAFEAVDDHGLTILVAVQEERRSTKAQCRIPFPEGVADFLQRWKLWSAGQ